MKKIILGCFMLFGYLSFGQTINGIPLKDLDVEYLQILGTSKMMSSKLTITIDMGQRTKLFSTNSDAISLKDEKGEPVIFNSMIDALNFMSANGYGFVAANVITVGGQNVYQYLLKRK